MCQFHVISCFMFSAVCCETCHGTCWTISGAIRLRFSLPVSIFNSKCLGTAAIAAIANIRWFSGAGSRSEATAGFLEISIGFTRGYQGWSTGLGGTSYSALRNLYVSQSNPRCWHFVHETCWNMLKPLGDVQFLKPFEHLSRLSFRRFLSPWGPAFSLRLFEPARAASRSKQCGRRMHRLMGGKHPIIYRYLIAFGKPAGHSFCV